MEGAWFAPKRRRSRFTSSGSELRKTRTVRTIDPALRADLRSEDSAGKAETMELAAFVDQVQPRPRESLDRLRYRAELGYQLSYPRRQNGNSG